MIELTTRQRKAAFAATELKQRDFAKLADVTIPTIYTWVNGGSTTTTTHNKIIRVLDVLGVSFVDNGVFFEQNKKGSDDEWFNGIKYTNKGGSMKMAVKYEDSKVEFIDNNFKII